MYVLLLYIHFCQRDKHGIAQKTPMKARMPVALFHNSEVNNKREDKVNKNKEFIGEKRGIWLLNV